MSRCLLLVPFLIAFVVPPQASAHPGPVLQAPCPDPTKALEKARFSRLGELPSAETFHAAFQSSGGCPAKALPAHGGRGRIPQTTQTRP